MSYKPKNGPTVSTWPPARIDWERRIMRDAPDDPNVEWVNADGTLWEEGQGE